MTSHDHAFAPATADRDVQRLVPGWRFAFASRAFDIRTRTEIRARAAYYLKMRIAYRIPYHELAEALDRDGPARNFRYAIDDLIEAYAPGFIIRTGEIVPGLRCPPWATRRYRAAAGV